MNISLSKFMVAVAVAGFALLPAPGQAQGGRGPAENWWLAKTQGGVYRPPMRPLWKLSDLKQMHQGQVNWQEQIIKDPEQDATYNSGAPGTKFGPRLHPDTPTLFVVVSGQMQFNVEGHEPVSAGRGSIINIMKTTLFSYDVEGAQNALWVEVNPVNYKTVYPASEPRPVANAGQEIVKVTFSHKPGAYSPPNQLYFNTFDAIAACTPSNTVVVRDDHLFASPLIGYVNPADNKCGTGSGNIGSGPDKPGAPAFNPNSVFGHMHPGPAEWWIVQVGAISGKFENRGEYHATEGDILYAAPMSWHQMGAEAPNGPSVRLALGAYELINMNNTDSPRN
jgi:mannose-6-phosphate isomerase-like protein (cupin superfamily)